LIKPKENLFTQLSNRGFKEKLFKWTFAFINTKNLKYIDTFSDKIIITYRGFYMNCVSEKFEKVLQCYEKYYDINRENPVSPFSAEAIFQSHTEQYFLTKAAKLSEIDSREYVFFSCKDEVTSSELLRLDEMAWNEGLSRIKPSSSHRNSDITLIIIAEKAASDAFSLARKLKHYKSYSFGFKGWSNYRVVLLETSSGRIACNRMGNSLKKIFSNI